MSLAAVSTLLLLYLGLGCTQNNGDLRLLQGGMTSASFSAGRLEIFINSTWGSVCADNFNKTDADVACRQLGYEGAVSTDTSFHTPFGRGLEGPVWLDEVNCSDTLLHLLSCAYDGVGEHDCDHFSDVAIVCVDQPRPAVPQAMDVRVTGGAFQSEGRVEVYCSGQWMAVCDQQDFQQAEADTVCRQLGYTEAAGFDADVVVTDFQVPPWPGQLSCDNETDGIASCGECSASDFNSNDDLSGCSAVTTVRCAHTLPYGSLRLVQNTEQVDADVSNGRLEIFQNGVWGTVCSDTFSLVAANISCKQLGFLRALRFQDSTDVRFGVGSDSDPQTGFQCTEDDQRLIQCSRVSESEDSCTHDQDVAVFCTDSHPVTPPPGTAPPDERSTLPTSTLVGILVGCSLVFLLLCVGLGVCSAHFYLVPYTVKKERHTLYFVERERERSVEAETSVDQNLEAGPMDSLGKNLGSDFLSQPRPKNRYVSLDTSRPDMIVDLLAEPPVQDVVEAESCVPQPVESSAVQSAPMPSPGHVSVHSLHVLPGSPQKKHSTSYSASLSPAGSFNSMDSFSFMQCSPGSSQPDITGPIPPPLKRQMENKATNDSATAVTTSSPITAQDNLAKIKCGLVNSSYQSKPILEEGQLQSHLPPSDYGSSAQESSITNQTAAASQHNTPTRGIMKSPKSAARAIRSTPHLENRRESEPDSLARHNHSDRRACDPSQPSMEEQDNHNHHVSFLLD